MDFDLPGMDTRTLSEKGVNMPVKQMDGSPLLDKDGKQVFISVLGPDSTKYRAMTRDQVRKRIQAASTGAPIPEDEDDATLAILVACTTGWTGINTPKGEPIPATPENFAALYTRYPVIRDQVDLFMAQRQNFILAS